MLLLVFALAVGTVGWCRWVYVQIERYAGQDQVAQAVQVAGAAPWTPLSYSARRSTTAGPRRSTAPAWTTRLSLYHHGIAPLIITLGGNGGDQYNEGAVGREYLMGMGVPRRGHHRRDREPQHRGVGPPCQP